MFTLCFYSIDTILAILFFHKASTVGSGYVCAMHELLRARIRQLGMNVATVAREAHVNRSFVFNILRGKSLVPNLDKSTQIAAVVKVDLEWLLSGKGQVDGDDPITEAYHNDFVAIQYAHARPSMGVARSQRTKNVSDGTSTFAAPGSGTTSRPPLQCYRS
jgi:transcriptional regulator with XRE-family HTH domain